MTNWGLSGNPEIFGFFWLAISQIIINKEETLFDGRTVCKPISLASSTKKFTSFAVSEEGKEISLRFSSFWKSLFTKQKRWYKQALLSKTSTKECFEKNSLHWARNLERFSVCGLREEIYFNNENLLKSLRHHWFHFFRYKFLGFFNGFFIRCRIPWMKKKTVNEQTQRNSYNGLLQWQLKYVWANFQTWRGRGVSICSIQVFIHTRGPWLWVSKHPPVHLSFANLPSLNLSINKKGAIIHLCIELLEILWLLNQIQNRSDEKPVLRCCLSPACRQRKSFKAL